MSDEDVAQAARDRIVRTALLAGGKKTGAERDADRMACVERCPVTPDAPCDDDCPLGDTEENNG